MTDVSDFGTLGSENSGFEPKNSRLPQTSKMRNSFLGVPGPKRSGHRRVPRPTICQNVVFDRTILKKTRLTTSEDVDARVQHVDRDGDLRLLARELEGLDQALGVALSVHDAPREGSAIVRSACVEPLLDELRMRLARSEYDGLANLVSTVDANAMRVDLSPDPEVDLLRRAASRSRAKHNIATACPREAICVGQWTKKNEK